MPFILKEYLCGLHGELTIVKQERWRVNKEATVTVPIREVTVVCTTELMVEAGGFGTYFGNLAHWIS